MRRSFTLIELIFSMVLISLAFTVLPKVLQVSAKSSITMLKEEAIANAIAMMGWIRVLAWDERNTQSDEILIPQEYLDIYRCPVWDIYRAGGFAGSRDCRHTLQASSIGPDGESIPNDIDDFAGYKKKITNSSGTRKYLLKINVSYVKDYNQTFLTQSVRTSSDVKMVSIDVTPLSKQKDIGGSFAKLTYFSSNIGQLRINRVPWKRP